MAETRDNGGPAFPVPVWETEHGDRVYPASGPMHGGMSLRDWFAGQALAGLVAWAERDALEHNRSKLLIETAEQAYEIADAMLAARKGKQDG